MGFFIGLLIVFAVVSLVFKIAFSALKFVFKFSFWALELVFSLLGWIIGGTLLGVIGFVAIGSLVAIPCLLFASRRF